MNVPTGPREASVPPPTPPGGSVIPRGAGGGIPSGEGLLLETWGTCCHRPIASKHSTPKPLPVSLWVGHLSSSTWWPVLSRRLDLET